MVKQKEYIEYKERSIELLENIKPEKNAIIAKWDELGIKA